jgi:hypothetical protein
MFQLIVSVTAIGMVASLTLAAVFYGGQAFKNGQNRAQTVAEEKGEVRTVAPPTVSFADGPWVVTDSY